MLNLRILLQRAGFDVLDTAPMSLGVSGGAELSRMRHAGKPLRDRFSNSQIVLAKCSQVLIGPLEQIKAFIPPRARFILVDEAQLAQEEFGTRRPIPFIERDGQYWGPPADAQTAIRECERLRRAGARYLVVTSPCFWWLDHYADFHRYLRERFQCELQNQHVLLFRLDRNPRRHSRIQA